jgi:hypothetical protein
MSLKPIKSAIEKSRRPEKPVERAKVPMAKENRESALGCGVIILVLLTVVGLLSFCMNLAGDDGPPPIESYSMKQRVDTANRNAERNRRGY